MDAIPREVVVSDFYRTLAQISFTVLGLWLVVVQVRADDLAADPLAVEAVALSVVLLVGVQQAFALVLAGGDRRPGRTGGRSSARGAPADRSARPG